MKLRELNLSLKYFNLLKDRSSERWFISGTTQNCYI
jgi:hypothetical protein